MTLKDKIRLLDFFRDLAYCDLDRLDAGEKAALYRDIDAISSQLFIEPKITPAQRGRVFTEPELSQTHELLLKDTLTWFQDKFFKIIDAITQEREGVKDFVPYGGLSVAPDGPGYGHVLEEFLIDLLPFERVVPGKNSGFSISATIAVAFEDKTEDNNLYVRWDPKWREKSRIRISVGLGLKNGLLIGFLRMINGLTPAAVRTCPACDQIYFHISKRSDRVYCSDKCTRREQIRQHREKQKDDEEKRKPGQDDQAFGCV